MAEHISAEGGEQAITRLEFAVAFHNHALSIVTRLLEEMPEEGIAAWTLFAQVESEMEESFPSIPYRAEVFESDLGRLMREHVIDIHNSRILMADSDIVSLSA